MPPTCTDGVTNGSETDVDCGGTTCDKCADGLKCINGNDCQSGVCSAGRCMVPTCSDGVQNGLETDVDCGGQGDPLCDRCGIDKKCILDSDCAVGVCVDGVCKYIDIVTVSGVRQWADGSYATSALAYRNPNPPYYYDGDTGDGMYKIYSGGTIIRVWCDMTYDGGGWTLVLLNSSYDVPPKPTWTEVVNNVNSTGSYGTSLASFDLFLGVKFWNSLGTKMRVEAGDSYDQILRRAIYDFNLDASSNYTLNLSNEVILFGGVQPGIYSYHNGRPLSTNNADHDASPMNCSQNFNNTAWWYGACWSGSFWGGGGGSLNTNNPYWYGATDIAGDTFFPWGAIWVK
jgi:hypothetical protein